MVKYVIDIQEEGVMMKAKKIIVFLSVILFSIMLSGCQIRGKKNIEIKNMPITHEEKFGGIYILITIEDFNKLGFSFGDSIDITFTNGYQLLDLPYYNGYYTNTGEALLVGYPGYPYIRCGINNGEDLYLLSGVSDSDLATIKLNKKAKYKDIQDALDIHYTDIQGDLPDEVFGNFREIKVGSLKAGILYRSASPCDNQHNRASVVDRLITNKVNTIINLSDNDLELKEHIAKDDFNSPWFLSVYQNGNVIALSMNMNFKLSSEQTEEKNDNNFNYLSSAFTDKLVLGLRYMLSHDGPYLIHCVEGKDRTGFVCMVLECLAGASYQEIIDDYMITYDNYYGITLENNPTKYQIIKEKNIDEMLRTIVDDETVDITKADLAYYIEQYLISKGLSLGEVRNLQQKLVVE